ncbi:DUF2141 domain-containing protein [Hymenobacter psychrotolerans]|uniref:Uncharacterized conserved protein, DUF2141 family n=1 Tax=Hymenobacter psychrotolerans DSM 18569 TaxID=1121959 RepID=A0A1M7BUF5_9BACT|nr:DUF2141 domain-containing protein [Hymenobacter psychrotolerans]SHL58678.1 Uncharacterized conserved protein, DUF2141 family [Hymenobacter psychrotolerans DSM 18569]
MKILTLACVMGGCSLLATAPAVAENPTGTSSVTVVVSALASPQSVVKLYFYNLRDKFLKPQGYAFKKVVQPGGQRQITLPVDLPHGEWAVAITQDMNNNDKLDKNFVGIPTEPFAFSNNVRPTLAPPDFNECKFVVAGPGKVVSIVLTK